MVLGQSLVLISHLVRGKFSQIKSLFVCGCHVCCAIEDNRYSESMTLDIT